MAIKNLHNGELTPEKEWIEVQKRIELMPEVIKIKLKEVLEPPDTVKANCGTPLEKFSGDKADGKWRCSKSLPPDICIPQIDAQMKNNIY